MRVGIFLESDLSKTHKSPTRKRLNKIQLSWALKQRVTRPQFHINGIPNKRKFIL
ncbi:hypothetical protein DSUL_50054 [Desulfovibrionales bacterium]